MSSSDFEYPEITSDTMGPSATPRKLKRKQPALSSEKSDVQYFLGLKEILDEPEKIYRHTWIWTGAIASIDYNNLARVSK